MNCVLQLSHDTQEKTDKISKVWGSKSKSKSKSKNFMWARFCIFLLSP